MKRKKENEEKKKTGKSYVKEVNLKNTMKVGEHLGQIAQHKTSLQYTKKI